MQLAASSDEFTTSREYVCVTLSLVNLLPRIDCGWVADSPSAGAERGVVGLLDPPRYPLACQVVGLKEGPVPKVVPRFSRSCHLVCHQWLLSCGWLAQEAQFKHRQLFFFTLEKAAEGKNTRRGFILKKQTVPRLR